MINARLLQNETETVWFYDPQNFPFVRELWTQTSRRKPPCSTADEIVVGYCPRKRGGERIDWFRWFSVRIHDFENYERFIECTHERIDPLTVSAGVPGHWTRRKLTAAQSAELDKFRGERQAVIEQKRQAARDRQRKCRAKRTKRAKKK